MARKIALALQGGGVHAAFAWGVLESLLDQVAAGEVEIVAVSGVSSGALNAAALVYGLREGARLPGPKTARSRRMVQAAREKLEHLWASLARAAFWGGNPLVAAIGLSSGWNIDASPAARWADMATTGMAPAETGIGAYVGGVLREVLPDLPAFLASPEPQVPSLVVTATDVQECRRQVFVDGAVSPDALKASLCLPTAMRTVEIEARGYWDGGYMGNPPLSPLLRQVRGTACDDLLLVTINPLHRAEVPHTPRQVLDRLSEVAFSAALVHEVHAIETLNHLLDAGHLAPEAGFRRVNLHRIHADADMVRLGVYSKDAPAWEFLTHLRDLGHSAFDESWPQVVAALGRHSSWDTASLCDQVVARGPLR